MAIDILSGSVVRASGKSSPMVDHGVIYFKINVYSLVFPLPTGGWLFTIGERERISHVSIHRMTVT